MGEKFKREFLFSDLKTEERIPRAESSKCDSSITRATLEIRTATFAIIYNHYLYNFDANGSFYDPFPMISMIKHIRF